MRKGLYSNAGSHKPRIDFCLIMINLVLKKIKCEF